MKLAPLLAQYLHNEHKLDLNGIGSFKLNGNSASAISFHYDPSTTEDPRLIEFITEKTGKQKALASSDLGSYLELARQFLNIGKPFHIEGVGTLVKMKNGLLEFTGENVVSEKYKDQAVKELSATSTSDHSFTTYESLKPQVEQPTPYKKFFLAGLIIATTAIILWAGYKMYKNNTQENNQQITEEVNTTPPLADTIKNTSVITDSIRPAPSGINEKPAAGNYRFVIEVANKKRALYRYEMLRKSNIPVQLATTDSIKYKLFFVLAATPADTARIADSLTVFYPALNKKRTFVEN